MASMAVTRHAEFPPSTLSKKRESCAWQVEAHRPHASQPSMADKQHHGAGLPRHDCVHLSKGADLVQCICRGGLCTSAVCARTSAAAAAAAQYATVQWL